MKIRFLKTWHGPYGNFTKDRVVDLSGPMLTAAPKDSYVAVIAEERKQVDAPVDKQQGTPKDKQVAKSSNKGMESDGKKEKIKKAEQPKKKDPP
jgi:hypothetical protein